MNSFDMSSDLYIYRYLFSVNSFENYLFGNVCKSKINIIGKQVHLANMKI